MTVFKVMFTAIITAMLGVTYLSWIGVLNLSLVYLVPTFLLPQVIGGLILGVGFVVGGYCPGTALAATATGRLDAIVYGLGLYAGTFLFAEAVPRVQAAAHCDADGPDYHPGGLRPAVWRGGIRGRPDGYWRLRRGGVGGEEDGASAGRGSLDDSRRQVVDSRQ